VRIIGGDEGFADEWLRSQRTARLATVGSDGAPHVVPVWFVWHEGRIYVASLRDSLKTAHAASGRQAAIVVDEGQESAALRDGRLVLHLLRGVEVRGPLVVAEDDPALVDVARRWARKYVEHDVDFGPRTLLGHVWLRLDPQRIVTWDYRQ
jgi:Pyridoxamine 5'-phosphate oxidase